MEQSQVVRLLSENNNKLKQIKNTLCCQTQGSSADDYEYIPVYEYKNISLSPWNNNTLFDFGGLVITSDGPSLVIQIENNTVLNNCTGGRITDKILNFFYTDSTGRTFHSDENISTKDIKVENLLGITDIIGRIHVTRESGFSYIYEFSYSVTTPLRSCTLPILIASYSNTNRINSNLTATETIHSYELYTKDILEVRVNGTFSHYEDLSHNSYTPTGCLSYNPVPPFPQFTYPPLTVVYNNTENLILSSNVITYLEKTIHSISYTAISGAVFVDIGNGQVPLPVGMTETLTATTLFSNTISIDTSLSGSAYITIIKP